MAINTNQKLTVFIDADNTQASVIQKLLAVVSRYSTATIKRAYDRFMRHCRLKFNTAAAMIAPCSVNALVWSVDLWKVIRPF